jgi:hypothetical protein
MFTANDIHTRIHQQPFTPLRIFTSSGQNYDITHPDLVLVGRRDLTIGTASNSNPKLYETVSRISILHITDIQDLPVSAGQSHETNGVPGD